jgi:hypothetical protein
MTWLFGINEGLWGVVQHEVSDLPFDSSWTADGIRSFRDYGQQFLDKAVVRLDSDARLAQAIARVHAAASAALAKSSRTVVDSGHDDL